MTDTKGGPGHETSVSSGDTQTPTVFGAWLRTRDLLREVSRAAPLPDGYLTLKGDLQHFTLVFKAFIRQYSWSDRRNMFFSDQYFLRDLEETIRKIENEVLGRGQEHEPPGFKSSKHSTKSLELNINLAARRRPVEEILIYTKVLSRFLEPSGMPNTLVPENHSLHGHY